MTDLSGPILTGAFGLVGAVTGGSAALLGPALAARRERTRQRESRIRELLPEWLSNLFVLRFPVEDPRWVEAAHRGTLLEAQIVMLLPKSETDIAAVLELSRGVRKLPSGAAFAAVLTSLQNELPRWVRGEQSAAETRRRFEAVAAPWRAELERRDETAAD